MADTDMSKWDFEENGDVKTNRLVEWGVASELGQMVMRVGYVRSQREQEIYNGTDRAPHQIQVSISAAAARDLSMQLAKYADWLDLKLSPEGVPNGV
ncbi:hypothetical protein [Rhizobium sp. PL01]|uniref:hypothetical protein n=1 Tax=Rhizobium sp. PL01 TaxID=3085631 RepID=UPI0029817EDA|nr:hypothetical protein [Rhizobium sp. PL01]MDW5317183.1 hypothetical protein [Rhizobium sp. PL01]